MHTNGHEFLPISHSCGFVCIRGKSLIIAISCGGAVLGLVGIV